MKLNKIMFAVALAFGVISVANAAIINQGNGTVTFKGAIVDSPCSITPESSDQTVNLGQVSNIALQGGGQSTPKNFQIKLENCEITTEGAGSNHTVAITFTGASSVADSKLLGITGTAKGAGIAITDGSGKLIELGKAADAQRLGNGNNTLSFAAYLQGSREAGAVVTPGEFQSVTDFTLAYQ
ncbi:Fimbria A protein precursor [Serratia proteamaculans]|uniref:fimbrial protein n=1 Tax=Serratia proteamaculans TaxID=28151 RepID=UPI002179FF5C|nr:fimbrial protein [Serratia proteamaculans]CAI1920715.1 Fimbria A protein precursor [Serratia proteamaculans]